MAAGGTRPSSTGMRMRQLPVKSSLPASSTMVRPAGKIQALRSRPAPALPAPAEATEAPSPARPMYSPASTASRNILPRGRRVLPSPTAK